MNHEDVQLLKILETIADRLIDMHLANQRQFAELRIELDARLPAIVTASEAVVPNEDEAMPVVADPSWEVLASCRSCNIKAYTEKGVEELFGYRTPADRETIVQNWCRYCLTDGKDQTEPVVEPVIVQEEPSPRKKVRHRMPPEVRGLSQVATKLAREGQALIKQAVDNASKRGRMSLADKKLLDAGTMKVDASKKLQSQYYSERELITYPNGRKR